GDDDQTGGKIKLRIGSLIGKQGLEKQFDEVLRGREGTRFLEISAKGVVLGDLADRPVDPGLAGADLIVTIDAELQRAAANSFDTFCCGAIVALDPRNGELLALVSKPDYDANIFSGAIPTDVWKSIINDTTKPLLNRPLDGRYPPASPFKLVTAGALLEEKLITEETVFSPCLGGWQFGRRWFRCWKYAGHGTQGVVRAIAESCDSYFYQSGLKLGIDKLAEYARLCGFGAPTGVDLPHENIGLVPTSDTLDRLYPDGWTKALTLNLSIGQGELLVTPLQVAQFYAGLANRGIVYTPHLLKTIIFPDGSRVSPPAQMAYRLPFSPATLKTLNQGLLEVVHSVDGTAEEIALEEFRSAGKTGTAQNPHGENHSWYVGYAPYENPQIVVVALIEGGGHGSAVAAPIVGKLLKFYLDHLPALSHEGEKESRG
ncbi:MAG: penicillin-binding transpeptidase domain-containing protein, partial [Candidatus Zixiibacteriota bacterium]